MSPKDATPVDPRSKMTDRDRFMTRSLHTPRIVSIVAIQIAKDDGLTGATEAVRRALRFLKMQDDYSAEDDPTMRKCVELTREGMAGK